MKNNISKIPFILSLVLTTFFVSCLQDNDYENNIYGIKPSKNNYVEIHLTTSNFSNINSTGIANSDRDSTYGVIPVTLTTIADHDISIKYQLYTLADTLKSHVLDSLVNYEGYSMPTTAQLSVADGNTVIIPKGEHTGYVKVKMKPSNLLGQTYLIGVKLTEVTDNDYSLSNLTEGFLKISIKNMYDGMYICNGYRIRPGNPTETVTDEERHLSTINAVTVQDPKFGNYSAYHVNVEVTKETIVVGGKTCYKVIATPVNDAGDVVGGMYTTFTGDANALPAPPANPTEINYYNPSTKTFVLNCFYFSSKNRIMYEVLVREN